MGRASRLSISVTSFKDTRGTCSGRIGKRIISGDCLVRSFTSTEMRQQLLLASTHLLRGCKEPTLGDEILEGNLRGMSGVRLEWKDATHLQITIPQISKVSRHRPIHKGITVDLQFGV